jgi:hypothetical protein
MRLSDELTSHVACGDAQSTTWFIICCEWDRGCSERESRSTPILSSGVIENTADVGLGYVKVVFLTTHNICLDFLSNLTQIVKSSAATIKRKSTIGDRELYVLVFECLEA